MDSGNYYNILSNNLTENTMSMTNKYKLHIGSYDWCHKSWENRFYPDDLPREWQFAYYANEYSVIMIPWLILQNNIELLEQGVDDSEQSCRLLFELPLNNINSRSTHDLRHEVQEFLIKIAFVGSRCLGIVVVVQFTDIANLATEKLGLVEELLKNCKQQFNTCLEVQRDKTAESLDRQLPTELSTLLVKTKIGLCRKNDINTTLAIASGINLHVTFCDLTTSDAKQMRRIVENSLVGECETSTNVLIFCSASPDHGQMNTASVISDLL